MDSLSPEEIEGIRQDTLLAVKDWLITSIEIQSKLVQAGYDYALSKLQFTDDKLVEIIAEELYGVWCESMKQHFENSFVFSWESSPEQNKEIYRTIVRCKISPCISQIKQDAADKEREKLYPWIVLTWHCPNDCENHCYDGGCACAVEDDMPDPNPTNTLSFENNPSYPTCPLYKKHNGQALKEG